MKQVGTIDRELQPGYPKVTAADDNYTLQFRYVCSARAVRDLPAVGSAYTGIFKVPNAVGKLVLSDLKAEPMKDEEGPWIAELNYTPEALYDEVDGDIFTTYELVTEDMDVPIEQHPNFLARWKYCAAAKKTRIGYVFHFFDSKDSVIISSSGDPTNAWILPGDQLPGKGWKFMHMAEKPGVEAYRAGVAKVRMVRTCPRREPLEAESRSVDYKIAEPKVTFGLKGKWLRGGSSIRRNGRKWELTVEYINSIDIDPDLYQEA